jgi:protein-S-isoprenylcysteine O-methyltransferase Ste14
MPRPVVCLTAVLRQFAELSHPCFGLSPPDFDRSPGNRCLSFSFLLPWGQKCDSTPRPRLGRSGMALLVAPPLACHNLGEIKRRAQVKHVQGLFYGSHPYLLSSIASVLTVAQIVLAFLLRGPRSEALEWAGWICLWTSSVFGLLPIVTLRSKGGVAQGQSYVRTTVLVDSGIYAIVRHPQNGTAWLLINLGVMLIAQHWSSLVLGLTSMALAYADTFQADRGCIEKFGQPYRLYMQSVPRANFVLGLIRLAWRRAGAR